MGMISIKGEGSFQWVEPQSTSAASHGHAKAVSDMIAYMTVVVMPKAIELDHKLHEKGTHPEKGFGKIE